MSLNFNEERHEYTLDGKPMISVTQLMSKHGISPDYSNVPSRILEAACARGNEHHKHTEEYVRKMYQVFGEVQTEVKVHNDHVAGTLDALFNVLDLEVLADLKTGQYHEEACRWQLSLYEYLLGRQVDVLTIMHLDKEGNLTDHNLTDARVPRKEIERLIQCDKDGVLYTQPKKELEGPWATTKHLVQWMQYERYIQELKAQQAECKAQIMQEMANSSLDYTECYGMAITYRPEHKSLRFSSKAFLKADPEAYEKYKQEYTYPESLIIKPIKEEAK
ncbi:hypothetical protein AGMMS49543_20890 [Betaproteobacteria bacterium]|nr:hypothetical protein AGMMS49543_20890 [Betaproteobacteria bacterium]